MGNVGNKCGCFEKDENATLYYTKRIESSDIITDPKAKSKYNPDSNEKIDSEDEKIMQAFHNYKILEKLDDKSKIVSNFRVIQNRIKIFVYQKNLKKNKIKLNEKSDKLFDQCLIQYSTKNLILAEKLYPKFNRELIALNRDEKQIKLFTNFLSKDKCVYKGDINVRSQRNGYGILIFDDGRKYEGSWIEDEFTGYGRYIDLEGNLFEGDFENFVLNKTGIKRTLNSQYYKGMFRNNLKDGAGVEITKEFEYEGEFSMDKKHGKGKITYKNGEKYEGIFTDDQITGFGCYTWKNKHTFEGDFIEGKMHGKGLYKWTDGSEYYGDYVNNLKEGNGIFKWPNGRVYKGQFSEGKPHGRGILTEKESMYDVEFDKGMMLKSIKRTQHSEGALKNSINYDPHQSIRVKTDDI